MGLPTVSMVFSPVFAHMGFKTPFKWVLTGLEVVQTCIGPICLSIWGLSGIRIDFKWGPFNQPCYWNHVGPTKFAQFKPHTHSVPTWPAFNPIGVHIEIPTYTEKLNLIIHAASDVVKCV